MARAKAFGIESHFISSKTANDMLGGILDENGLYGGLWLPGVGTVSPSDLTVS